MPTLPTEKQAPDHVGGGRCYGCFRPHAACFCAAIPKIDNCTEVLIVQHLRERFHPFNTARLVQRALTNSSLLVDNPQRLGTRLSLKPRAGLLYPGPEATLISELSAEERPEQLVILDGTWHHTKTLVRDIAALRELPRYRLAPTTPGRYRIRREPSDTALSTVEATVEALRVLEPEIRGLDQLLTAFSNMVERQLAHPKARYGWRKHLGRSRTPLNIPWVLLGALHNVVVVYAEAAPGERRYKQMAPAPIYWVAERLGSDERFTCAIQHAAPLSASFLDHLQLSEKDFSSALSPTEACAAWAAFRRPADKLVVYHPRTAGLLARFSENFTPCLMLKSVDFNPQRRYATLDEIVTVEGLEIAPAQHPGRAGQRLAQAIALVRRLNAWANVADNPQDVGEDEHRSEALTTSLFQTDG